MLRKDDPLEDVLKIATLADAAEDRIFRNGEYIFKQGENDPHFYVVLKGEIEISVKNTDGIDKVIAYLKPGELLGEGVLLGKTLKPASARAQGELHVLQLSYDDFQKWSKDQPESAMKFLLHVLGIVNKRLNRSNVKLIALFEMSQQVSQHRDDLKGMAKGLIHQLLGLAGGTDGILVLKNPFGTDYRAVYSTTETLNEKSVIRYNLIHSQVATDTEFHVLITNLKQSGALVLTRPLSEDPFDEDDLRLVQLIADYAAGTIEEASRHAAEKAKNILHQKRYTL